MVTFLGVVILVLVSFAIVCILHLSFFLVTMLDIILYTAIFRVHKQKMGIDTYEDVIACIIAAVVSLFALTIAVGFLYYGIRIYSVLRHSGFLAGAKRFQAIKVRNSCIDCECKQLF